MIKVKIIDLETNVHSKSKTFTAGSLFLPSINGPAFINKNFAPIVFDLIPGTVKVLNLQAEGHELKLLERLLNKPIDLSLIKDIEIQINSGIAYFDKNTLLIFLT